MRCEMVRRDVESVSRNASLGIIIHSNSLAQPPGGAPRRLVAVPTIRMNNNAQRGIVIVGEGLSSTSFGCFAHGVFGVVFALEPVAVRMLRSPQSFKPYFFLFSKALNV